MTVLSRLRREITALNNRWYHALWITALAVNGVAAGIWRFAAPSQQFKVFSDGSYISLPTADYHPFDGLAIFVLATGAIGLVMAAAMWRVRSLRGIRTLLWLTACTALGSLLAAVICGVFSTAASPWIFADPNTDVIATIDPRLPTALAIVAEPLMAVVTYTFLTAWDGRADLGRRRRSTEALG